MSYEELPNEFDIVVLGTGLTTTITAAAFSRIGLKVLHLDRNDYYGGSYANFNLDAIEKWKRRNQELNESSGENRTHGDEPEKKPESLPDGVTCVSLPQERAQAFNLTSSFHVRERTAEEEAEARKAQSLVKPFFAMKVTPTPSAECSEDVEGKEDDPKSQTEPCDHTAEHSQTDAKQVTSEDQSGAAALASQDTSKGQSETADGVKTPHTDEKPADQEMETPAVVEARTSVIEGCEEVEGQPNAGTTKETASSTVAPASSAADLEDSQSSHNEVSGKPEEPAAKEDKKKKEMTVGDIKDEWRRYCFDISPRVLHCCGDMIELLIRSDVARYCEFRTVSRVLTLLKDKLESVPCSRADVFGSKIVSLIEKRLMMKFLQFAADFEKHPEEYEGSKDSTFLDFLKSKKLTANLQHFVQHAIAMVNDSCSTLEGLTRTRKFLQSLGRYGNTAFLFPMYGTGELSQAFSRLSAVFGGVYCLDETATHILSDAEANCCGIVTSKGQKINCKYLIAEASYLPDNYVQRLSSGKVSRGIYITDASISSSSDDDLTLLNFICKQDSSRPVTVLEVPSSTCVCPRNLYVVYLTRVSESEDPEEDLSEVRKRLFAPEGFVSGPEESRPNVLWSMHFTLHDWSRVGPTEETLGRVLAASHGGDAGIDLDFCVPEAKRLFHLVCPDEDFLPAPPNPEDIIHVDDEETAVAAGDNDAAGFGAEEGEKGALENRGREEGEAQMGEGKNVDTGNEERKQAASGGLGQTDEAV